MALTARLTPDETDAVREFLVGAARAAEASAAAALNRPVRLASASRNGMVPAPVCCELAEGRSVYERQCVACHGKSGKGDGPAAVALNPRPADLTNLERMATINDDSLVLVIAKGRKGMPAYGKLLTQEQVLEVANYLRSLKP
jgi:mono/diheme cytochrome c family protein